MNREKKLKNLPEEEVLNSQSNFETNLDLSLENDVSIDKKSIFEIEITNLPKKAKEDDLRKFISDHYPKLESKIQNIKFERIKTNLFKTMKTNIKGSIKIRGKEAMESLKSSKVLIKGVKLKFANKKTTFLKLRQRRLHSKRCYFFGNLLKVDSNKMKTFLSIHYQVNAIYFMNKFSSPQINKLGFVDFKTNSDFKTFIKSDVFKNGISVEENRIDFFDPMSNDINFIRETLKKLENLVKESDEKILRPFIPIKKMHFSDRWKFLKPSVNDIINTNSGNYRINK